MNRGFGIGRLFGIRIRIDWSWLFIFALVTWGLGSSFRQLHPDWGGATAWVTAVSAVLLFFVAVLAHEMAHSLFARSRGVPVKVITLFLFGGVSNIERDPDTPRSEFIMAVLGPLASLFIGAVLYLIALAMIGSASASFDDPVQMAESLSPVTTVLLWLGTVNILLAFFNLVPGFPLDGGRMLRSVIWAITGDLVRATRYAAMAGQTVAWLLIVVGISMVFGLRVPIFGTGLGGLWLAFIGWFLNTAASNSYRQVVVRDILEHVSVGEVAAKDPPTVSAATSIDELVHDWIMRTDDHAFPVIEDGALVGLVTLGDVRSTDRSEWEQKHVRDIMTRLDDLETVSSDSDAATALMRLVSRNVRQLPVVDGGRLTGLFRRRDIVRWLQFHSDGKLGSTRSRPEVGS